MPAVERDLFLLQNLLIFNGAHPPSYLMGTGNYFPEVKQSGRKVHRSPLSSAGDKEWNSAVPVCPPGKLFSCCESEDLNVPLYVSNIVKMKLLTKAENKLELEKTEVGGTVSCS